MIDFSFGLPVFIVTLREGFEAALVVGIVLACLQKAGQISLFSWVYRGIFAAIISSILVGLLIVKTMEKIQFAAGSYSVILKQFLAGILGLIAIILLSWMLVWMSAQAKSLKSEIENSVNLAIKKGSSKGVFLIVFIAVLREGFESVIFLLSQFESNWQVSIIGAITGLLSAALLAFTLFYLGIKINLKRFFQVMGILLILIVGGLIIGVLNQFNIALKLLSELDPTYSNWCFFQDSCILGQQLWDASDILPERQFPGIIFKVLLGYRESFYWGQFIAYILLVFSFILFYFQSLKSDYKNIQSKKENLQ